MKRRTAKHSDRVMRFFTPELFVRFNSADDDVADRADAEWERAVAGYKKHLTKIWPALPEAVRKLARLRLHDAEVINRHDGGELPRSPEPFPVLLPFIRLREAEHEIVLIYWLSGQPRTVPPPSEWPFSTQRPHWLYDEVDVGSEKGKGFTHRVLISDGTAFEIPFTSVAIHRAPPSNASAKNHARRASA